MHLELTNKIYKQCLQIVEIAGLQYKVEQDQKLFVHRLKGDKRIESIFRQSSSYCKWSAQQSAYSCKQYPVDAEILDHVKADKVIIFKKKRRKRLRKEKWSRQSLTQIVITGITGFDGAKKTAKKETAEPNAAKAAKTETKAAANRDLLQ